MVQGRGGEGRWSCGWLAVPAAHQWSGCAHGTWEQWPCGEERAGKELAQQTAPHQETPARGPRPHTPSASGICVPDGDGRVQGVRLVWAGGSAQCTCRSLTLGGVGRSSLTFEIAILFDQSEVGKQQGLSCPWVHLCLG